jgi:hypothetical protein
MVTKPYNPACFALAEHFLQDEPSLRGDRELYALHCSDLARAIQDAIENWLFIRIPPEDL